MTMVIARMKVTEGKVDEFKQIVTDLAAQVREEPGCTMYDLCACRDPGEFVIIERYTDRDALGAHSKSAHVKAAFPKLGAVLDDPPAIEVLTEVG